MKVKQHDITDCGAACLASVSDYYGLRLSIARIRQFASTDKKGTNVLGLLEAAEQLGFSAKAVKAVDANGNGWQLHGLCTAIPKSWHWTKPPLPLTPNRNYTLKT